MKANRVNRREALKAAGVGIVLAAVPRSVLGGPKHVAPSEKVNIGYVGCGTQGLRQLLPALEHPGVNILAVADPNRKSDDYPEWGRGELNQKISKFLGDPNWARGARWGLCGRDVGLEVVNRHYGKQKSTPANRKAYLDYREMLAQEKDLDALYIMTPDHHHGVAVIRAMRAGKHVVTHKPIANVLDEVRLARETARQTGLASQLFCSADSGNGPTLAEWIAAGVIGPVREVHNWSTRPFWPQGMTEPPQDRPPTPEGLDWNLWLGPAAERPYSPAYTHAVFRGWFDFGTGALGDMGHYSFHQIFEALRLGSPTAVEAGRSEFWKIEESGWRKQVNRVSYPQAQMLHWDFPARGELPPVTLHWYDGGLRPPMPKELYDDGGQMPDEGMLLVGDQGKILAGFLGDSPRLLPKAKMSGFKPPAATLPRPVSELDQFVRACRGGQPADANFESAYPFAETILLGTIAVRIGKKLRWDAAKAEFDDAEANRLKSRTNRAGWEV